MNIVKGLGIRSPAVIFDRRQRAMDAGNVLGYSIARRTNVGWSSPSALCWPGVLAEPAVHVLTHQIETVTSGSVKAKMVMASFSFGRGCTALAMVKIVVPQVQLWHFLLPGYVIVDRRNPRRRRLCGHRL